MDPPLDARVPLVEDTDLVDEAMMHALAGESVANLLEKIRVELASGDD